MIILAKLDKEEFDVYKVIVIKELKRSKRIKLAPIDQNGEVISGQWSEYNMPNEGVSEDWIKLKYRIEGKTSHFSHNSTAYRNIIESCPRTTDLNFLFEQKEKENIDIKIYNLKENKKRYENSVETHKNYSEQKKVDIENLKDEIKNHSDKIITCNDRILKINERLKELKG